MKGQEGREEGITTTSGDTKVEVAGSDVVNIHVMPITR